jgi:cyclophilin family peptidyl-prolyl cis-trans isomerase
MSLMLVGDWDPVTMIDLLNDADWQVRRLIAGRLNLAEPEQAVVGDRLDQDVALQVRYDLLAPQAALASANKSCEPMVRKFSDPSPVVVMRAMDLIPANCTDLDDAVRALKEIADGLEGSSPNTWQVPARAFENLARLRPGVAGKMLETAANFSIWQVRVTAAKATVQLKDGTTAARLAKDGQPNVATAALDALFQMLKGDDLLADRAISALNAGSDFDLLRTAANVLAGVKGDKIGQATEALVRALRRVGDSKDTSRDARLAMITRLGEIMPKTRSADLLPLMTDLDDTVIAAARKLYVRLMEGAEPMDQNIRRRYPFQPPEAAMLALPKEATINLEGGPVTLKLLPDVAPVTVARFAMLVNQKFYDRSTFHRIVTNFVVQGGSPGANEYMGTSRYMRDEPGPQASHIRGAVGISTRGGDTGDGQIFIDLVDVPRLDRDYTVFAYVTGGMELVDKLLEGGKILSITVK